MVVKQKLEFDLLSRQPVVKTLMLPMPDRGFHRSRGFDDDDLINHRGVETLMWSCGSTIGGDWGPSFAVFFYSDYSGASFEGEIHEILAFVYYDSVQNVVPFYDQHAAVLSKDATWRMFCENSMKHFKQAFAQKLLQLIATGRPPKKTALNMLGKIALTSSRWL
ncbi:hypothetical protein Droror1_Dr00019112 [Drosera rotundifolia]